MMEWKAFCRRFDLHLNEQQQSAVRQTQGPVLLLAVPGSGKTTALLARVGWLVYGLDVPPESILTVTYTVAAAGDLRRRFERTFGPEHAGRLEVRTINGMCARIIRQYEQRFGRQAFRLVSDEKESARLVREAWKACGRGYPSDAELEEARTRIAYCKNAMLSDEDIRSQEEGENLFRLLQAYRQLLLEGRLMDYDDQMVYGLKILRSQPAILQNWQDRYRYFHVDEAQDTSRIQHAILGLLASRSRDLFLVGDEDQSIYGFRAACPQALTDFEKDWPGARVLYLETNYRSTGAIVAAARRFIGQNTHRRPKQMTTPNARGAPVERHWVARRWSQYEYLAQQAQRGEGLAILYRNHESALPLIDLLEQQGTPYTCRGQSPGFFTHPTVRDVVDILQFSCCQTDSERFLRIYYKFRLGISKDLARQATALGRRSPNKPLFALAAAACQDDWLQARLGELQRHMDLLPLDTSAQALGRIFEDMGFREHLRAKHADEGKLDILMALARANPDRQAFLDRLALLEQLVREDRSQPGAVVLSTIHGSKGLEYDRVILMDVVDGVLPQEASPLSDRGDDLLEEERRLFYVAMTRAKNRLEMLSCRGNASSFTAFVFPEKKRAETRAVPKPSHKRRPRVSTEQFREGIPVLHKLFGRGLVCAREGDVATIRFEDGQVKKLVLSTVADSGMLQSEKL